MWMQSEPMWKKDQNPCDRCRPDQLKDDREYLRAEFSRPMPRLDDANRRASKQNGA
jgi:hypothetical protein